MDIVWDIVSTCNRNLDINVDIVWAFSAYQWQIHEISMG